MSATPFLLLIMASLHFHATVQAATQAHTTTSERTVCDVSFANIAGLSIRATLVPEARWRSRVDIERYSACPYDVLLTYQGQSLRLDFSTAVTLDSIAADSGMEANTGFFTWDGENWISNDQLKDSPDNMIKVQSNSRERLVTGTVERQGGQGQQANFCFSVALIRKQGMVTGALCAARREAIQPFSTLFSDMRVMTSSR